MGEKYVRCLYDASWNLSSQSDFETSDNTLNTALTYCNKYLKNNHTQKAKILSGFANLYLDKTEYDKALEYYFKSLNIQKKLFGENHIKVANLYNNIGIAYLYKSEYNKSLQYFIKSSRIKKKLYLTEKNYNM